MRTNYDTQIFISLHDFIDNSISLLHVNYNLADIHPCPYPTLNSPIYYFMNCYCDGQLRGGYYKKYLKYKQKYIQLKLIKLNIALKRINK